jgi:hypothetical protein
MEDASDDQQMRGVNVTRKPLGLNLCDVGDEEKKHWSVGIAGCREEHRWVAHQDSKMCPECRGILDTRLERSQKAPESYVSSTLEL